MEISVRAVFHDSAWREWLQNFPDYDQRGGHLPAVIFKKEVKAHLIRSQTITAPIQSDHAVLTSELAAHFDLIGAQIAKKTEIGVLAAVTGGIGLAADFFLPGSSYALTWISGMLVAGGSATKSSAAREILHVKSAKIAVILWLRRL